MTAAVVDVLGTVVRVEVPSYLADDIDRRVGALLTNRPVEREVALVVDDRAGRLRLVDDGLVVLDNVEPQVGAATIFWRLNAIAAESPNHLVLHAGCVSLDGRAAILPGRSGAGKSELCAACLADGYGYLSDEQAAIDLRSGLLTPFPKPLDTRRGLVMASELGSAPPAPSAPPAAVVFPRFDPQSPTSRLLLPRARALLVLAAHTHRFEAMGVEAFLWLAGLAAACEAWEVTYSSSSEGVAAVHDALVDASPAPLRPMADMAPMLVADSLAAVVLGGEVVVFDRASSALHHLNATAAFVWLCAVGGPDGSGEAQRRLGSIPVGQLPADVERATMDRLAAQGLLGSRAPER